MGVLCTWVKLLTDLQIKWAVNCTKCVWRPGSAWTRWGRYSAPPNHLAVIRREREGEESVGNREAMKGS